MCNCAVHRTGPCALGTGAAVAGRRRRRKCHDRGRRSVRRPRSIEHPATARMMCCRERGRRKCRWQRWGWSSARALTVCKRRGRGAGLRLPPRLQTHCALLSSWLIVKRARMAAPSKSARRCPSPRLWRWAWRGGLSLGPTGGARPLSFPKYNNKGNKTTTWRAPERERDKERKR